jgi:hypothetical protein
LNSQAHHFKVRFHVEVDIGAGRHQLFDGSAGLVGAILADKPPGALGGEERR